MHRSSLVRILFLFAASYALAACSTSTDSPTPVSSDLRVRFNLKALPAHATYPANNPYSLNRFVLGWNLFYDPILSGTRDVACGTCHHPNYGMSDGRMFSLGVDGKGLGPTRYATNTSFEQTARNAQSIINAAFNGASPDNAPMFWDGRAHSLEDQAAQPIANRDEMAGDMFGTSVHVMDSIVKRLQNTSAYYGYFENAFPLEKDSVAKGLLPNIISASTITRAIACFEREIISNDSRYDQFVNGQDSALSMQEQRGLVLFYTKANCGSCHSGAMFSDFDYHSQGVAQVGPGRPGYHGDDIGRAEQSGKPNDYYRFRTPSLRNVEITGPYMHDGSLKTLEEVVDFYNTGISQNPHVTLQNIDYRFRPLGLTAQERTDLVAFLKTLTGDSWQHRAIPPTQVPSGLRVP